MEMASGSQRGVWIDKFYALITVPLLLVSFYVVDHSWDASEYVAFVTFSFDGTENLTADRLDGVNYGSTAFRLVLAGFGFLGLILPSRYRIDFRSPVLWCWLAYWGWLYLSVVWSVNPEHTGFKLVVLGVYTMAAIGISRRGSFDQWNFTLAATCCGFILLGVVAEIILRTFIPWTPGYRFTGTTHPNTEAAYGIVACLVGSLYFGKSPRWTIGSILFLAIGLSCVVLTKSRTSLAAMIIGVSVIQALRAQGAKRFLLITAGVGVAAIGLLVLSLIGGGAKGKIGKVAAMGRSDDVSTLTGRLPLWAELIDSISDRPLIGHGYLGYWDAARVEYLGDIFKWEIPHGHNMYLDVLMDAGAVGLSIYLLFLLSVAIMAARSFTKSGRFGAAALFGLVFVVLIHGIGESLFKLPVYCSFMLYSLVFRLLWIEREPTELDGEEPDDDEAFADPKPIVDFARA